MENSNPKIRGYAGLAVKQNPANQQRTKIPLSLLQGDWPSVEVKIEIEEGKELKLNYDDVLPTITKVMSLQDDVVTKMRKKSGNPSHQGTQGNRVAEPAAIVDWDEPLNLTVDAVLPEHLPVENHAPNPVPESIFEGLANQGASPPGDLLETKLLKVKPKRRISGRKPVPEEEKSEKYMVMRVQNTQSARKSREKKRALEEQRVEMIKWQAERIAELQQENQVLKGTVQILLNVQQMQQVSSKRKRN